LIRLNLILCRLESVTNINSPLIPNNEGAGKCLRVKEAGLR
jgi:hypothetical protein